MCINSGREILFEKDEKRKPQNVSLFEKCLVVLIETYSIRRNLLEYRENDRTKNISISIVLT